DEAQQKLRLRESQSNESLGRAAGRNLKDMSASPEGNPKTVELLQEGKAFFESGRLDDAETKLRQAVKEDPKNQDSYYYLNRISEERFKKVLNASEVASKYRLVDIQDAAATKTGELSAGKTNQLQGEEQATIPEGTIDLPQFL